MASIPKEQSAAVKNGKGDDTTVSVQKVSVDDVAPHQILVKINWSGLCASDKGLLYDEWSVNGTTMQPATKGIAGHEGAGVVVKVGADVADIWKVGDRAGIKWVVSVCRHCENSVDELQCAKQLNSGFTVAGTFQELYCVTDGRYATRIPDGVSDEEAGPIMCGGLTAYTACKKSAVRASQWIVILGAGGGLGHFAVQYAKAMGMRVIAIDGGEDKEKLCKKLGAEHFIDFQSVKDIPAELMKITGSGAHGAIVFSSSKEGYVVAPSLLRAYGTLVAVGVPSDPTVMVGAPPILMIFKKLNITGSSTGTLKDMDECLSFTARGLVHPILTKGTLEDVDRFCHLMRDGQLPGRAVLKVGA